MFHIFIVMKAIYGILNKINGKKYIGSATNFYKRKSLHLKQLNNNEHHSKYLQRAWNKYGEQNFEFFIIEKIDCKENLIIREQWWLDNSNNEYNVCKIAGSPLGIKRDDKTKEKCRLSHIGKKLSKKHKEKIKESSIFNTKGKELQKLASKQRKLNGNYKPVSIERKNAIKEANSLCLIALNDDGNIIYNFQSHKEAYTFLGISESTLYRILKSNKKYINLTWKKQVLEQLSP